ncbi:hypothetical protein [Floridanema aerugineum]|uniref:Large polyvalent protein-associated domain-containing protein n=1 Tax=Floridaenema aerugineum BLCC-F46 TaxID=3153654 RepID=A0ABV4XE69_9CYAN
MPTKSTNKPKQFSTQKRDWSVLTATETKHVKRLEHIQETLDAAIESIQEEGGIEDWEDFKNFVESFNKRPDRINESGNQKASISVDLVAEGKGDEISGFVFYLTKDPSLRTSGVYLVKNLKQAGVETKENNNYYTPSHVTELIGLENNEIDQDFDDDLTDLEEDEELPKPNKPTSKLSKSKQSPKQEEDDIDQLLSDDETTPITTGVLGKIAKNRSINNTEPKYPLLDSLETFLKETEHQGEIATTRGSEINGITVTGLTVQSATLIGLIGAKTVSDLIDYIQQAREKEQAQKLEEILEQIDSLNQRTDNVSVRVQQADVIADIKAIDNRTEKLAERTKQILETPTTNLEIEEQAKRNGSHHIITHTQSNAVQIGEKIDNLGHKLDPEYKQSPPLQIDKEANISEQLDQIQKYLGNLSKRLDRLETIVDQLEQKNAINVPEEPEDLLTKIVTQTKVQQQQEAVADCLVNYAFATGQSPQSGIMFDDGGILYVTAENNKVNVAIKASDGNEIFSATKEGERWKIAQDKLTPEEREAIFKLPQSEPEYDTLATAQALVDKFQNTFPKRFSGEKDPVFPWREPRREDGTPGAVKYEFEILDLPDGSQQLIGTNPRQNDAQVFDAILIKGKPPDIRECHISIAEMESLVGSPEKEKHHHKHNSPERSKEDENELQA